MRYILIFSLLLSSFVAFAEDRVFDTKEQRFVDVEEFSRLIPASGQVVMGEYHYQSEIQEAQGKIIRAIVEKHSKKSQFTVAWEFLNYTEQNNIAESFLSYRFGDLDALGLFEQWFPLSRNPNRNAPYISFVNATASLAGEVIGVNAPRTHKSVITAGGIEALDPELVPPTYEIGSENYLKRFKEAMGDHVPANKLKNYFEAQSYTDSMIAHQMMKEASYDLQFLIVGSFHTDFLDGVIRELGKTHTHKTTSIKIVNKMDLDEAEFKKLLSRNRNYGHIADFIYFTNWK